MTRLMESCTGVMITLKSHSGTLIRGNDLVFIKEQRGMDWKRKSPWGVMQQSHFAWVTSEIDQYL